MKTFQLHLIRNGLTAENLEGRYIGHTDVELSPEGIAQLEQMARDYRYPEAQVVFSSPLKRCTKTAELIYGKAPVAIGELIEYDFGEFEGKTAEELENYPCFPAWLAGEEGAEPPFGESNPAFIRRICSGFEKIVDGMLKSGVNTAAIVTHGGVIMSLMAAYALPQAPVHEWLTPNGCGYTVRIIPSVWMGGRKVEAVREIPCLEQTDAEERALWGYTEETEDDGE